MTEPPRNLLANSAPETLLPEDPAVAALKGADKSTFYEVVRAYPTSSLCWALLAEASLSAESTEADVAAYAYARTGYHRGLDALRRAGWKGTGPIPWEHEPNRGFLRALWALAVAAQRIGDVEEEKRCKEFLRDSSETAWTELSGA